MSNNIDLRDTSAKTLAGRPPALDGGRTIGQLVADASNDVSALMRYEIAMAKTELKKEAVNAGAGAGLIGAAALFGFAGFLFLWATAAFGLVAAGLSHWLSFGIVTLVLLVIAAILALVAKGRFAKLGKPERTIATAKDTVAAVKGSR